MRCKHSPSQGGAPTMRRCEQLRLAGAHAAATSTAAAGRAGRFWSILAASRRYRSDRCSDRIRCV